MWGSFAALTPWRTHDTYNSDWEIMLLIGKEPIGRSILISNNDATQWRTHDTCNTCIRSTHRRLCTCFIPHVATSNSLTPSLLVSLFLSSVLYVTVYYTLLHCLALRRIHSTWAFISQIVLSTSMPSSWPKLCLHVLQASLRLSTGIFNVVIAFGTLSLFF